MTLDGILFGIKLLFQRDKELYAFCYRLLGFCPGRLGLYRLAFAHRSRSLCLNHEPHANNERLEFLGDAVLDAVVADMLYKLYPHRREGFLTNTRSKIVKRESLSAIALKLGLDRVVRPVLQSHSHNLYVYGNALEALVGAVYLDKGYRRCKRFVEERIIGPHINIGDIARTEINFKSKLLEWGQRHHLPISFELVETTTDSDNNSQMFRSVIKIGNEQISGATGYTKKESHQKASERALKRINGNAALRQRLIAQAQPPADEQSQPMGESEE